MNTTDGAVCLNSSIVAFSSPDRSPRGVIARGSTAGVPRSLNVRYAR